MQSASAALRRPSSLHWWWVDDLNWPDTLMGAGRLVHVVQFMQSHSRLNQ